jgi:hypothetical protein
MSNILAFVLDGFFLLSIDTEPDTAFCLFQATGLICLHGDPLQMER